MDLHATSVCDKGLKIYLKSQNSAHLKKLNLAMSWKRVTDAMAKALVMSKYCSSLMELNLEDCLMTDEGVTALCDSPNCNKL